MFYFQLLHNFQAINAILQIQQGMEQLRNVAPNLVNSIGLNNTNAPVVPPPTTGTAPTPTAAAAPPNNPEAFTQVSTYSRNQQNFLKQFVQFLIIFNCSLCNVW